MTWFSYTCTFCSFQIFYIQSVHHFNSDLQLNMSLIMSLWKVGKLVSLNKMQKWVVHKSWTLNGTKIIEMVSLNSITLFVNNLCCTEGIIPLGCLKKNFYLIQHILLTYQCNSDSSTAKCSAAGASITGSWRWPL